MMSNKTLVRFTCFAVLAFLTGWLVLSAKGSLSSYLADKQEQAKQEEREAIRLYVREQDADDARDAAFRFEKNTECVAFMLKDFPDTPHLTTREVLETYMLEQMRLVDASFKQSKVFDDVARQLRGE